ncbi:hypothetical protein BDW59DRAFT_166533 [Aspergillus cavernicola]|uniref:Uncharacterized protein n=1 Tax=Aspergillus cavernicola TaxID=176166 RepID=A0ABR4HKQ6_9EURO
MRYSLLGSALVLSLSAAAPHAAAEGIGPASSSCSCTSTVTVTVTVSTPYEASTTSTPLIISTTAPSHGVPVDPLSSASDNLSSSPSTIGADTSTRVTNGVTYPTGSPSIGSSNTLPVNPVLSNAIASNTAPSSTGSSSIDSSTIDSSGAGSSSTTLSDTSSSSIESSTPGSTGTISSHTGSSNTVTPGTRTDTTEPGSVGTGTTVHGTNTPQASVNLSTSHGLDDSVIPSTSDTSVPSSSTNVVGGSSTISSSTVQPLPIPVGLGNLSSTQSHTHGTSTSDDPLMTGPQSDGTPVTVTITSIETQVYFTVGPDGTTTTKPLFATDLPGFSTGPDGSTTTQPLFATTVGPDGSTTTQPPFLTGFPGFIIGTDGSTITQPDFITNPPSFTIGPDGSTTIEPPIGFTSLPSTEVTSSVNAISLDFHNIVPVINSWEKTPSPYLQKNIAKQLEGVENRVDDLAKKMGGDTSGGGGGCGSKKKKRNIFGDALHAATGAVSDVVGSLACTAKKLGDLRKGIIDKNIEAVKDIMKDIGSDNDHPPPNDSNNNDNDNEDNNDDDSDDDNDDDNHYDEPPHISSTASSTTSSSCTSEATAYQVTVRCEPTSTIYDGSTISTTTCSPSTTVTTTGCTVTGTTTTVTATATPTPTSGCSFERCGDGAACPRGEGGWLAPSLVDCATIPSSTVAALPTDLEGGYIVPAGAPQTQPDHVKRYVRPLEPIPDLNEADGLERVGLLTLDITREDKWLRPGFPVTGRWFEFGYELTAMGIRGLSGCTAIIIVTNKGVYFAHIWEIPVFSTLYEGPTPDDYFRENTFETLKVGTLDKNVQPVAYLVGFDRSPGALHSKHKPQIFVVTPFADGLSQGALKYPERAQWLADQFAQLVYPNGVPPDKVPMVVGYQIPTFDDAHGDGPWGKVVLEVTKLNRDLWQGRKRLLIGRWRLWVSGRHILDYDFWERTGWHWGHIWDPTAWNDDISLRKRGLCSFVPDSSTLLSGSSTTKQPTTLLTSTSTSTNSTVESTTTVDPVNPPGHVPGFSLPTTPPIPTPLTSTITSITSTETSTSTSMENSVESITTETSTSTSTSTSTETSVASTTTETSTSISTSTSTETSIESTTTVQPVDPRPGFTLPTTKPHHPPGLLPGFTLPHPHPPPRPTTTNVPDPETIPLPTEPGEQTCMSGPEVGKVNGRFVQDLSDLCNTVGGDGKNIRSLGPGDILEWSTPGFTSIGETFYASIKWKDGCKGQRQDGLWPVPGYTCGSLLFGNFDNCPAKGCYGGTRTVGCLEFKSWHERIATPHYAGEVSA